MKLRILIRTPKGQAKGTIKNVGWILGVKKKEDKIKTNKEDNKIIWEIDANSKRYVKVTRNVSLYNLFIDKIFTSKMYRKALKKKATPEQIKEVEWMLKNQTRVRVIKRDEVYEI